MMKKAASFVLARHCRLTISAAFTNVTRFIQRVVSLLTLLRPRWTTFLTILTSLVFIHLVELK